jgi:murein DD-endopeptidase MepM/ murein hydrolase activator NlpD
MKEIKNMEIKLTSTPLRHIYITQPFGASYVDFYSSLGLAGHNGIDFRCFIGTPVVATHDGKVYFAGEEAGYGIKVVIWDSENGFKTIYGHLSDLSVKEGDKAKAGQLIGHSGNTGKYTTGPHLHFEIRKTNNTGATLDPGNSYGGAENPASYFSDKDWDKTPAAKRYGRQRTWQLFLSETKVMISLRTFLKRNPTFEEINACAYGFWDRDVLTNPALAYNWKYLTKIEYQSGIKPFTI